MIYTYVALALAIFSGGFASGYRFELTNTQRLELAIQRSNSDAEQVMQAAKLKVANADTKAAQLNQQIETSHVQSINTINALSARVSDAARVYNASRKDCANTLSADTDTAISAGESRALDTAARVVEFAQRAAKLGDESSEYAQQCWAFVTNNCGIAK